MLFFLFRGSFRFVVFVYTCFLGKDKVQEQVGLFFLDDETTLIFWLGYLSQSIWDFPSLCRIPVLKRFRRFKQETTSLLLKQRNLWL